ncbi:hypothetical protein MtrunA17_Chr0c31g0494161 [Medicago truncatula]|uniref:Uncharacterized protein n=1 Tax=Medicago truncatula TaxID=3880 RepID=A0A396G8Z8_MEDTR|nr:hypothetical protein MtrunA17_Chr0c31g0494161 [Medicago truncatula]
MKKNKLKCKVFLCRWRGFNYRCKPLDSLQIERERHDKERTLEEHKKLVDRVMKRDKKVGK